MNVITISNFDQFSLIFDGLLCLSGEQSEEICQNMWCISLGEKFIENITLEKLENFIDQLIENRVQQLKSINFFEHAVFYMWFDQQALQLRFNIITGDGASLPFGCKLKLHSTSKFILTNLIVAVKRSACFGDDVEFLDSEDDEDEDEEEYILDVFVKKLTVL
jgi:hypothetical protein